MRLDCGLDLTPDTVSTPPLRNYRKSQFHCFSANAVVEQCYLCNWYVLGD